MASYRSFIDVSREFSPIPDVQIFSVMSDIHIYIYIHIHIHIYICVYIYI